MSHEQLEQYIEYSINCTNDEAAIPARRAFMEQLLQVGLIVAPETDLRPVRTGFMCKVDFDLELGAAVGGNSVYGSAEDARKHRQCIDECGLVEVEVRLKQVVQEGF